MRHRFSGWVFSEFVNTGYVPNIRRGAKNSKALFAKTEKCEDEKPALGQVRIIGILLFLFAFFLQFFRRLKVVVAKPKGKGIAV